MWKNGDKKLLYIIYGDGWRRACTVMVEGPKRLYDDGPKSIGRFPGRFILYE